MIYFRHILRWIIKFFKFPFQSFNLFFSDIKKDYFPKIKGGPNIIIVIGLPKSGTTYIEQILSFIGYVDIKVSPLRIFENNFTNKESEISENIFKYVPKKKYSFIKVHSPYSNEIIKIIEKYNLKVIFSKRSLIDTLISRYCHVLNEKKHRHHNEIKNLNLNEGFKKSLTINNSYDTPISPLNYFNSWLENWNEQINKKKLNFLILDYEKTKDKKNYINSIIKYLDIKNCYADIVLEKINYEFKKNKNLNLEENLNNFLKPKTFNKDSYLIRKQLDYRNIKEFVYKNLKKNY